MLYFPVWPHRTFGPSPTLLRDIASLYGIGWNIVLAFNPPIILYSPFHTTLYSIQLGLPLSHFLLGLQQAWYEPTNYLRLNTMWDLQSSLLRTQIKHFFTSCIPSDSSVPCFTLFVQACKSDPHRRGHIAELFAHVIFPVTAKPLDYASKWEETSISL